MKTWNIYSIGRQPDRRSAKFVGQVHAEKDVVKCAVVEVSEKYAVTLEVRDASTDAWRRPMARRAGMIFYQ